MRMSSVSLMTSRLDVICKNLVLCKFRIDRRALPSVLFGLFMTTLLLPFHVVEYLYYRRKIKKNKLEKPVFIVGHWRGGTTLWQYLLSRDKNFAFLDPLSAYSVNTAVWKPLLRKPLPPRIMEGRGFDNMEYRLDLPWEESICFAQYSYFSNWGTHLYPSDRNRHLNYAFVDEMPLSEQEKWFRSYDNMMRKFSIQLSHGRSMVLKSPDITARVKYMYEKYPDAVFINVYRNPYAVIRSTINMFKVTTRNFSVQKIPSPEDEETFIIMQFKRIYQKFFDDVKSIPSERFIEFRFEDFEKDPMPMLQKTYEKFGWDWAAAKDALQAYWDSYDGYKKNVFDYSPRLIRRINEELDFYFEHYGYEKLPVPDDSIVQ